MAVVSKPIALPRIALTMLWEWEGLGEPHPVVGTNGTWLSEQSKAALEEGIFAELAKQDMASGRHLAPELRETLRVLASASHEIYAWVADIAGGDSGAIMVAALGADAVRLMRDERAVLLDPIAPNRLAEHFVEALPDVDAAKISPITVPKSSYSPERAPVEEDDFEFQLQSDYAPPNPSDQLAELMRHKRTAEHKIYVARRNGGTRLRSEGLTAIDLAGKGRVLTYLTRPDDGEQQIHCVPASDTELVARLRSLAESVTR